MQVDERLIATVKRARADLRLPPLGTRTTHRHAVALARCARWLPEHFRDDRPASPSPRAFRRRFLAWARQGDAVRRDWDRLRALVRRHLGEDRAGDFVELNRAMGDAASAVGAALGRFDVAAAGLPEPRPPRTGRPTTAWGPFIDNVGDVYLRITGQPWNVSTRDGGVFDGPFPRFLHKAASALGVRCTRQELTTHALAVVRRKKAFQKRAKPA